MGLWQDPPRNHVRIVRHGPGGARAALRRLLYLITLRHSSRGWAADAVHHDSTSQLLTFSCGIECRSLCAGEECADDLLRVLRAVLPHLLLQQHRRLDLRGERL